MVIHHTYQMVGETQDTLPPLNKESVCTTVIQQIMLLRSHRHISAGQHDWLVNDFLVSIRQLERISLHTFATPFSSAGCGTSRPCFHTELSHSKVG